MERLPGELVCEPGERLVALCELVCATFSRFIETGASLCGTFCSFLGGVRAICARQSLIANFQFPCSYLRDSVRTRQRLVWLKVRFTQHTACVLMVCTCPSSTEKNPSYLRAVD